MDFENEKVVEVFKKIVLGIDILIWITFTSLLIYLSVIRSDFMFILIGIAIPVILKLFRNSLPYQEQEKLDGGLIVFTIIFSIIYAISVFICIQFGLICLGKVFVTVFVGIIVIGIIVALCDPLLLLLVCR